jgi:hypothetical protein
MANYVIADDDLGEEQAEAELGAASKQEARHA